MCLCLCSTRLLLSAVPVSLRPACVTVAKDCDGGGSGDDDHEPSSPRCAQVSRASGSGLPHWLVVRVALPAQGGRGLDWITVSGCRCRSPCRYFLPVLCSNFRSTAAASVAQLSSDEFCERLLVKNMH